MLMRKASFPEAETYHIDLTTTAVRLLFDGCLRGSFAVFDFVSPDLLVLISQGKRRHCTTGCRV